MQLQNINVISKNVSLGLEEMIREVNLLGNDIDLTCVNDNASNMKLGIKLDPGLERYFCDINTNELSKWATFKNIEGMANVLKKTKGVSSFTNWSNIALEEL